MLSAHRRYRIAFRLLHNFSAITLSSLGRLQHVGIAQMYDAGATTATRPFPVIGWN